MGNAIVIGMDVGGTSTRIMVADHQGSVRAYKEVGPGRLDRDPSVLVHVQQGISDAVEEAGGKLSDVTYVAAGVAGLDGPKDEEWAAHLTELRELGCPRIHVNDAVIAHVGALRSRPGIVVISGTGSVVYGITEAGEHIRNYDMQHDAETGARHLGYHALFPVVAGETVPEDQPLIHQLQSHWDVTDTHGLRDALTNHGGGFTSSEWPKVGQLAPIITQAAMDGVPLAQKVCQRAAEKLVTGIRLVGSHFGDDAVPVVLIGSVVRSPYLSQCVRDALSSCSGKRFDVTEPEYSSQAGAVLMALQGAGLRLDDEVLSNLRKSRDAIV